MKMGQLKEYYKRFKQWQQKPLTYTFNPEEVNHCNNCDHDFTGNFCPVCSQKSGTGRISWKSVRQGVMDIWGLGSRSMLFSIFQLLLRPGYMIREYISGKRQVSFPPVKMLFVVTVIYALIAYWLLPELLGISLENQDKSMKHVFAALGKYSDWEKNHYSWAILIMSLISIFPTWLLFRYAPRYPRHTLPEGFFIQILFSVIIIVISLLLLPFRLMVSYNTFNTVYMFILGIYYIVGYKQLFGYGLWGTLWRSGFVLLFSICIEFMLIFGVFGLDLNVLFSESQLPQQIKDIRFSPEQNAYFNYIVAGGALIMAVLSLTVGYVANMIATNESRKYQYIKPE